MQCVEVARLTSISFHPLFVTGETTKWKLSEITQNSLETTKCLYKKLRMSNDNSEQICCRIEIQQNNSLTSVILANV